MNKKIAIAIAALVLVALVIGGYIWFRNSNGIESNTNKNQPVVIGYSKLRISLPIFVAEHNGYFKAESIQPELKSFDTAQPLMDALVAGHIKMGGFTAYPITFSAMQQSNVKLYFAGMMLEDEKHPISMLLKKKDSPISKISDLKGKRIGILPTTAYKEWLETILQENGVDPKDVTITPVAPSQAKDSLNNGQVDALFYNDPVATTTVRNGIAELITPEALVPKYLGSPFPFGAFNFRKDFADENPELVRKVNNALNKAIDYINEHPQESKEIMKVFLPDEQDPFVPFYPDALYVRSDKVPEADLKKIEDICLKIGVINKPVQLEGLLYR